MGYDHVEIFNTYLTKTSYYLMKLPYYVGHIINDNIYKQ